jgi:hypothetical protein
VELEKWIPIFLIAHPRRKIRIQFHGYKHISLILLDGELWEMEGLPSSAQNSIFVTFVLTLGRRSSSRVWL